MPKRLPTPKHAPAIPLSGSVVNPFHITPALSAAPRAAVQDSAAAQAREDRITHYFFVAYMLLTLLGVAAMGYALLTM